MKPFSPSPRDRARRDPEADAFLRDSARRGRIEEVSRAKCFARIAASHHYVFENCAGIREYGLNIGFGSDAARDYTAAGQVMAICPAAEQMVLDGEMTISSLAIIAPYFLDPRMTPLDEDGKPWTHAAILDWAKLLPDKHLLKHVRQRERDVKTGERTIPVTLHFTRQGTIDLDRSQVLLMRKTGGQVSKSEAAEKALREYVETHDPLEQTPGTRRLPEMPERTDGTKNPRSVPAEVKRELMARHGDVCAIRYCENKVWLQHSHHTPHSEGGGNEAEDQHDICSAHHRMKDHGEIRWVSNAEEPGGGHYVARNGHIIRLKPIERPSDPSREPPGDPREDPPAEPPGEPPREPPGEPPGAGEVRERAPPFVPSRRTRTPESLTRPPRCVSGPASTPSWRRAMRPRRARRPRAT